MKPGGDGQTDPCLSYFNFEKGVDCIDVIAIIYYALETQPDLKKEKRFRFIAEKGLNSSFLWEPQLAGDTSSYCGRFVDPRFHEEIVFEGTQSMEDRKSVV